MLATCRLSLGLSPPGGGGRRRVDEAGEVGEGVVAAAATPPSVDARVLAVRFDEQGKRYRQFKDSLPLHGWP